MTGQVKVADSFGVKGKLYMAFSFFLNQYKSEQTCIRMNQYFVESPSFGCIPIEVCLYQNYISRGCKLLKIKDRTIQINH